MSYNRWQEDNSKERKAAEAAAEAKAAEVRAAREATTKELIKGIQDSSLELVRRTLNREADLSTLVHSIVSEKEVPVIVYAAETNTRWEIVQLIAELRKESSRKDYGFTAALFLAISAGEWEAAKSLVRAGADLSAKNDGKTSMAHAADAHAWEFIEWIATTYKTTRTDTFDFGFALLEAVMKSRHKTASLLLEAGALFAWFSLGTRRKVLHEAVVNNDTAMLKILLPYMPQEELFKEDQNNHTPLSLACSLKHWECASLLVAHKSFKPKLDTTTAESIILMLQEKQTSLAITVMRLISGENVPDSQYGLLHWGIAAGSIKIPQFILANNLTSQISLSKDGKTAVEFACEKHAWNVAQLLIETAQNPAFNLHAARQMHYDKALLHAIRGDSHETAELLLLHGANCRRWNSEKGNIALHTALSCKNIKMVLLLLKNGADPYRPNKDGNDTLALAKSMVSEKFAGQIVEYLKSKDSKLNFYAPLNTSNISDVLLDYSVEELEEQANRHIKSLQDQAVDFAKSFEVLQHIVKCRRAILVQDLDELDAQRTSMEQRIKANTKDHPLGNMPSEVETQSCAELIRNINLLIKNPHEVMPLDKLRQNQFDAAKHILSYVHAVSSVTIFKTIINQRIDALLAEIKETSFPSTHVAGSLWLPGKPEPVKQLLAIIAKRSHVDTTEEIFAIYNDLLKSMNESRKIKKLHPDTSAFLERFNQIFSRIDFNFCAEARPLLQGNMGEVGVLNRGMYQGQDNLAVTYNEIASQFNNSNVSPFVYANK